MTAKLNSENSYEAAPPAGFDVTVRTIIGRVILGEEGERPDVAAFKMIALHGEDGVYEFPGPDENTTTRVQVTWTVPDK